MAKGGFVGGFMGNKWVRVSIYSVLVLLIVWVLYLLAKKFIDMIGSMSPGEEKEKNIDAIDTDNNEYADTPLSDAEAEAIADAAYQAMRGGWTGLGTTCSTLFSQIDPWRDDPNALRKIYKAYGVRDGYTLFETYVDELADSCGNNPYVGWMYPCDVPYDCGWNGRNLSELGCMRWYWENSGMGGF
jgi:hypothetical protein